MKILVIDDNAHHLAAAKMQLESHEIVTTSSFEEAKAMLGVKEWNFPEVPDMKFDVVLTDLMLPAPARCLGSDAKNKYAGQVMPLGMFLVMLAMKAGVKMVGLLTDTNHHAHPASAAIDMFHDGVMQMGENRVILSNRVQQYGGGTYKDWKSLLEELTGEVIPYNERINRVSKWIHEDPRFKK